MLCYVKGKFRIFPTNSFFRLLDSSWSISPPPSLWNPLAANWETFRRFWPQDKNEIQIFHPLVSISTDCLINQSSESAFDVCCCETPFLSFQVPKTSWQKCTPSQIPRTATQLCQQSAPRAAFCRHSSLSSRRPTEFSGLSCRKISSGPITFMWWLPNQEKCKLPIYEPGLLMCSSAIRPDRVRYYTRTGPVSSDCPARNDFVVSAPWRIRNPYDEGVPENRLWLRHSGRAHGQIKWPQFPAQDAVPYDESDVLPTICGHVDGRVESLGLFWRHAGISRIQDAKRILLSIGCGEEEREMPYRGMHYFALYHLCMVPSDFLFSPLLRWVPYL